ncbi:MAG: tyrosine-type recombinase/integrase [Acidobacteria bacterium]|nr:tyrosine-type recombinase/integrase [Acidobacteriota bacterium]MCA1620573.1 tyrosine-type recombinase/integrase [Acidobacteriota bacterium]
MTPGDDSRQGPDGGAGHSRALAAPDTAATLREAVTHWAEQNTRPETLARAEKLRDKVSAVTSFFEFAGRHLGEVTPGDVSRWRAEMEGRGLKPATVYARVSRVSAFYRWLLSDPRLSRLIAGNPAALARPRFPRPYQSESTKALSDEEMNALLAVVRRLAEGGSVVGKRDYALLLFYFLTGLRRSEVIGLRGKDLETKEGSLVIKYRRKGGKFVAREVADPSAGEALDEYLEASGRPNVLGSERPLWTRHDRAGKPGAPLTARAFVENLKSYAREAGLAHIHLHQTRHTYARIVAEETGSFLEAQEALDHENPATTRVYVQRITVKADRHGAKVAGRLKLGRITGEES